jgi:hypothetical protein
MARFYVESGNNYTKHITMARASSMPKYMQLLKEIKNYNDFNICSTRRNLVASVWHKSLGDDVCRTWNNGPFTLLNDKGLATWVRKDGQTTWHITDKGRSYLAECDHGSIKEIKVSRPEYRGAPYPKFDPMKINVSRFEYELRDKWCEANIDLINNVGSVVWESQEAEDPTEFWEAEIKRAFKKNGLKPGSTIHVKFGSRDTGIIHKYDLKLWA